MLSATLLALTTLVGLEPTGPEAKANPNAKLAPGSVGDITGYYSCRGDDGKGGYTGVAVISKQKDIYLVQWTIGVGSAFVGLGIRQGETLAVSWAMAGDKGGVVRGINYYRIEPGPRLVGQWATLPGNGMLNTETLSFLKRLAEE